MPGPLRRTGRRFAARTTQAMPEELLSYCDFSMLNLGGVVYTKTEPGGVLDVTRFPEITVHTWIGLPIRGRAHVFGVAIPNRDRALLLTLVVDHVDQEAVDGHGVRSEFHLFGIEAIVLVSRERSGMPDAAQSVHDVQHRAGPQGLDARQR